MTQINFEGDVEAQPITPPKHAAASRVRPALRPDVIAVSAVIITAALVLIACTSIIGRSLPPPVALAPTLALRDNARWTLKFHDEFEGQALDRAKWITCLTDVWCADDVTLQHYVPENVRVVGGKALLTAKREKVGIYDYSSGALSTFYSFATTHGFVEIRARAPRGNGLWTGLWMMPVSRQWPPEIDIVEVLGREQGVAHFTAHFADASGQPAKVGAIRTGTDFFSEFHTYGLRWGLDELVWYLDGVEVFRSKRAPNVPMHVIVSLAVGGPIEFVGLPDASTPFPSTLEVDYVRAWQEN